MCELIGNYFPNFFTLNVVSEVDDGFLSPVESMVTEAQNVNLIMDLSEEDFKRAIKQTHLDKAPGNEWV